jgi:hypothetical protein
MRRTNILLTAAMAGLLVACGSGNPPGDPASPPPQPPTVAVAACSAEVFVSDIFAAGSINNQHGWLSDPASAFDESVEALDSSACRGNGAWKISNAVTSAGFGNQPISPALALSAGESTVRGAGGGDTLEVSFHVRTVDAANADGSSFVLSFSPVAADRHNYLRFTNDDDADGGFNILALDGALLNQTHAVKTGISRGLWHHIRIRNRNIDGLNGDGSANDIVEVFFDGVLVSTHSTWEAWRATLPATTLSVNRTLFRMAVAAGTFGAFAAPQGFYIDDYTQRIFDSANPAMALEEYRTGFEIP